VENKPDSNSPAPPPPSETAERISPTSSQGNSDDSRLTVAFESYNPTVKNQQEKK